ncbi:MAG: sulfotransferase domain-containing protein [Cytophagia bacterium]|nr:sulfotransferase domain-containing protein [Cytophagia bacterium]
MKKPASTNLPLCIIGGFPRGGTTFLYHYLSQHPEVFAPSRKEINYFSVYHERGVDWYNSLFEEMKGESLGIDVSPFYFLDQKSIQRILQEAPEAKIILSIRKPSEMVCAMYAQISTSSLAIPSIENFIESYHWNIGSGLTICLREFPFYDRIKEYQKAFGDNLLYYSFEEFEFNPLVILQRIENHLELNAFFNNDNFNNHIINASERRNSRLLSLLLRQERLIDTIVKLLPRKAILKARGVFLESSKPRNQGKKARLNPDHLRIAHELLYNEDEKVMSLFNPKDFITRNK